MSAGAEDPKLFAAARFAAPAQLLSGFEIITRYATDVPLAVETLREAVRPRRANARICELGFGTGYLLEEAAASFPDASLFGLEMSQAMIEHVRGLLGGRVSLARGDMEALPFADESFDCVATLFTLYFMRDIDTALQEIRRVLRPGGKVVAATVAPDHMKEYDDVSREVLARVGGAPIDDIGLRFDLESGHPYMERNFPGFELREWRGEMPLPVDVFVRFWEVGHEDQLRAGDAEGLLTAVRERAVEIADADGIVHVRRHDGAFVGYKT
jgi:SAM-dependent methyltransferase